MSSEKLEGLDGHINIPEHTNIPEIDYDETINVQQSIYLLGDGAFKQCSERKRGTGTKDKFCDATIEKVGIGDSRFDPAPVLPPAPSGGPLTVGLQAYYKLDEAGYVGTLGEVIDSSTNAYHGEAGNGTTPGTVPTVPGLIGTAADMTGPGLFDYLSVADNSDLELTGNTWSISFWVNWPVLPAGGEDMLIKSAFGAGWQFTMLGTFFAIFGNISAPVFVPIFPGLFLPGTWHHIAMTHNVAGFDEIYIDGTPFGTTPAAPNNGSTTSFRMEMGKSFSGKLDEIAIWDRELSAGEITSLFNGGAGLAIM